MSWPGIPAWLMHDATTYVVDGDLRELPAELAKRFKSLLQQLRRRDVKNSLRRAWLSPIQMALLHVHALFNGLRPDGAGVNVSARAWAKRLGCTERAVTKAFERLKELGLLNRWPRLVRHEWNDAGVKRARADADGVSYITPAGMEWLHEREIKIRRQVVLSTWAPGGVKRAVVVAAGLLAKLLEPMRAKLRRIAARLLPSAKQDRPTAEDRIKKNKTSGRVGGRAGFSRPPPGSAAGVARKGDPASDLEERQRLRELFEQRRLTPWDAWPDRWKPLAKFEPRTTEHGYLETECEKWIRFFEDETNATERTQPEFRHRPDDPRPARTRSGRRGPTVNQCKPKTRTNRQAVHNWEEYET